MEDINIPAPGLSLSFGRRANPTISARASIGDLGRTRRHTYERYADVLDNGDVFIQQPGAFFG
ncbi:MAG: hypothetical protein GY703_01335 [Gammaproteobacteria bacterium]|nr:hypothetical protein [Gammaproteobacteria bacterium]